MVAATGRSGVKSFRSAWAIVLPFERRLLHHPRIGVDADVLDPRQEVGQAPVSAGEVDEPIAVLERRPERADQLGAMT